MTPNRLMRAACYWLTYRSHRKAGLSRPAARRRIRDEGIPAWVTDSQ